MIIKSVRVQNFRSILDETLECAELTAMVGVNGAGKSSFLRALELFYAPSPRIGQGDFYAEDTSEDIEVGITYTDLDEEEAEHFKAYLQGDDLTVVRVLSLSNGRQSAKFYGSRLQNPDFVEIRRAGGARDVRRKYDEVRTGNPEYADLPAARSQDAVLDALGTWEADHSERSTLQRDDGQFFGFTEVAQGYLGRYTRLIAIPAVRDASEDAAEGKGAPITEIIDLVVRSTLAGREDIAKFREDTQKKYDEIMDAEKIEEIKNLEGELTGTLRTYVPDSGVALSWDKAKPIDIPMPKANVKLLEDGYSAAVARTGHGLQRAFILTLLQHLAVARTPEPGEQENGSGESSSESRMPNLILGIEEPELYQHPNRQRHLARVLLQLVAGGVVAVTKKTQIIYGTHSPLFVGIDRFNQVRLFRKVRYEDRKPKITKIFRATLGQVAELLWEAAGRPIPKYTEQTLRPRL